MFSSALLVSLQTTSNHHHITLSYRAFAESSPLKCYFIVLIRQGKLNLVSWTLKQELKSNKNICWDYLELILQ